MGHGFHGYVSLPEGTFSRNKSSTFSRHFFKCQIPSMIPPQRRVCQRARKKLAHMLPQEEFEKVVVTWLRVW